MRATVTLVAAGGAVREDARIEAAGSTPVGELLARLRHLVAEPGDGPAAIGGVSVEPGSLTPFAGSAFRDGAVVSFATPLRPILPASYFELMVVSGPAAGTVHSLVVGTSSLGRGATAAIRIDDPDVSRRHATITVSADGITVVDDGSTNGTALDGRHLNSVPVALRPGMRLRVGQSTLVVTVSHDAPVAVTRTGDGRLSFNRPPRLDVPDRNVTPPTVTFPAPPVELARHTLPVIATVAPLVAGILLAVVMRRPEYLLFTIVSPLMMAGQWVGDRVGQRRAHRVEQARYANALITAQATLARALADEVAQRRSRAPDAATLSIVATGPGARLWERRRADGDFLLVSLGSATLPAELAVVDAPRDTSRDLHDVPATVSLRDVGVLGIAGPLIATAAIARSIIGQLAVLHSPRDLTIVLMTEPARVESWDWVRWLPHTCPSGDLAGAACDALVGLDTESNTARAGELAALIETRQHAATSGSGPTNSPAVVVVVDGAWALRDTRAIATVLAHGPAACVFAVCIDDAESRLPAECKAVAVMNTQNRLVLRTPGDCAVVDLAADGASVSWAERIARALAPMRDDSPDRSHALPEIVRWLDIADLTDLTDDVAAAWRHPCAGTTRALIGVGPDGRFAVDLAVDGPHALIAGTTGSGKSELLQTLVASLAVANRPDDLTFVLVDYKGGAAFGACAALPHTVGMVTDLDGRLVERALVSLSAELKRREALLATAGAPNLDMFRATGGRLARLVIVVDEFASLAEELPDFVGGLVAIAQRGRSLGVHLVLATQRPEGVVSADIRANTNLRVCLGVARESESRDVIDSADAARISRLTPGRAYARTGHGELHAFQTGRVGGERTSSKDDVIDVALSPFRALCRPAVQRIADDTMRGGPTRTDLDDIVDACRAAAARLHLEAAAPPWLPPLPETIGSDADGLEPTRALVATLAVLDVPTEQRRERYVIDLDHTGHLIVAGSARSGRTTALRTLVGGLASSTSVADLHVYAVDCAGGSLAALSGLPHCGAAVGGHEADRVGRLFSMLVDEMVTRQQLSAVQGWGSLAEQRATSTSPLPHVLLLIDGWEAFSSAFDDLDAGVVLDAAWRLVREGASVGVHVVVTADRAGLIGRLASSVEERLVLKLADRSDFSMIGVPARAVPTVMPAGRGFLTDRLREAQVCVLGREPSGAAQLAALAAIATAARERASDLPPSARPRRVDPLPLSVTLAEIMAHTGHVADQDDSTTSARVVLGVGGDELDTVSVDLLEARPGFLIAGPARSGRSTALATLACGLRTAGWRIVAVAPRSSIVSAHADHMFDANGLGLERALADDKVAVLVDDAERLAESPVAAILDRVTRTARDTGHLVAVAGLTEELSLGFRGFIVDARRARAGLLLSPRSALDGDVLGIRLPRSTGAPAPAGRGLLVIGNAVTRLQVARPDETDGSSPQPHTVTERLPIAAPSCVTVMLTTPSAAPVK